jgi:exodeoxyribonuclease III
VTRAELTEARRIRREAALAAREQMTPPGRAAPDHLRIGTWNVNSLKARAVALKCFLDHTLPDVLLLQETKSGDVAPAAQAVFSDLGYQVVHAGQGQYNGVAIASLHPLGDVLTWSEFDEEHLAREPRLISVVVDLDPPLRVASVYVPHGREVGHWHYEYKLAFLAGLRTQVERWLHEGSLLLGGDFNVAPTDSDIFHPDAFVGNTHVTAAERDALSAVLDAGLIDLDARRWGPRERRFTWWKPGFGYSRNLGMRIDLLAADRVLAERLETTWIDHVGRGGDRPSDHAALLADFRPRS